MRFVHVGRNNIVLSFRALQSEVEKSIVKKYLPTFDSVKEAMLLLKIAKFTYL